jgi:predicted O-methyltransferase YrrM
MAPEHTWTIVDTYLESTLLPPDPALAAALARSAASGLPPIQVPPLQGRFLQLLATAIGARRILEFGTLAGYSTIWLARALPAGGRLTSLEIDPAHAEVARANLAAAGLADRVDVVVGPAAESLARLDGETFDLTFVDADKTSTAAYVDWAAAHTRPGGVIVVDNVVRDGAVADGESEDPSVRGIRRFLEQAAADARLEVTALQTVGAKGYDGFALAVVR